jgi:tetratricopeptide (TPR) repeat protein
MHRRALALLTGWVLTLSAGASAIQPLGLCSAAHAQPLKAGEPLLDTARAHFVTGVAQARRGDWPSALASFSAAYRLAPEPAVLFNLAGAQYRCGKLLAANTNYRRLLATADERLSRAERQAIAQQIARIELRMPRLRIHIEGLRSDDRVLLDHARLYPDELDRDMWVDPGTHQLRVIRARGQPEVRTIVLAESELRTVALGLP